LIMAMTFVLCAPLSAQIDYNDVSSTDLAMSYAVKRDLDIVDIASNIDEFSTLVTALKTSGLDKTLKGKGPFTVFAPLNSGFGKLPDLGKRTITSYFVRKWKRCIDRC